MGPMWGFWWIFPLIGLAICVFFVIAVVRMMCGGGPMCMRPHDRNSEEMARLRKEVEDLRDQVKRQGATR